MTEVVQRRPRLLPAPDPNPPYDSHDRPWRPPEPRGRTPRQGVLALEFQLPSGVPARPGPLAQHDVARQPDLVVAGGLPPSERWSRMLAEAFADVLNGTRPAEQLRFWVTKNVHRRLLSATRLTGPRPAHRVRTVHRQSPVPGVVEVTATLHDRDRAHAMAFRMEERRGHWVCTALDVGLLSRRR
jgi:hypothetical protein